MTFLQQLPLATIRSVIALAVLGILFSGCDLSEDDEDFSLLIGSWQFEDVRVDEENVSLKSELDARYTELVITFREDENETEFFTLVGQTEGGEDRLDVSGNVGIDSDDDEITLFPEGGTSIGGIELDFRRPDASTLRLSSDDDGDTEEAFLDLIQIGSQRQTDRLVVLLSEDG